MREFSLEANQLAAALQYTPDFNPDFISRSVIVGVFRAEHQVFSIHFRPNWTWTDPIVDLPVETNRVDIRRQCDLHNDPTTGKVAIFQSGVVNRATEEQMFTGFDKVDLFLGGDLLDHICGESAYNVILAFDGIGLIVGGHVATMFGPVMMTTK